MVCLYLNLWCSTSICALLFDTFISLWYKCYLARALCSRVEICAFWDSRVYGMLTQWFLSTRLETCMRSEGDCWDFAPATDRSVHKALLVGPKLACPRKPFCLDKLAVPFCLRAHGVVVSHPLRMRKALGSIPSVSTFSAQQGKVKGFVFFFAFLFLSSLLSVISYFCHLFFLLSLLSV